jgi:hypothetical protein
VTLRAIEWRSFEPIDDGASLRVAVTLGALEPRRIEVEDGPDAVTVAVYDEWPDGTTGIPQIGISTRFEVPLPTPLAGRHVVDGASGARRDVAAAPGVAVRGPVGEDFRWKDVAGKPWWGQRS